MARTQSAKHFKQQRKVATNLVQILPTRQAVDQPLSKNVDPPPIYSESPPSELAYLSFSELYYTNAASLRSSSAETLVSDYSPAPMDWDRETLYDPTASFRDSFYKTPDEDELPIPGKDFIFDTPFIPDSPSLSSHSSPTLCEQQLIPTLGGDILMVDNFSAPEEDVVIDELRNEFEEKLTLEQTVIPMEVDIEIAVPAVPPPKNTVSSRHSNPAPPTGCVRSSKLRSRSSRYDTSKSLTKRRLSSTQSVSQSQSVIKIKGPSRTLPPAAFISKILKVSSSVAKSLLPPPPSLPSTPRRRTGELESQVGPIAKERCQHRQQHAFNCEHDQTVYEPNLEAEVPRDIESHESKECPPIVVDGSKKVSSMRKMVSQSARWMKKVVRVHQELKRRT